MIIAVVGSRKFYTKPNGEVDQEQINDHVGGKMVMFLDGVGYFVRTGDAAGVDTAAINTAKEMDWEYQSIKADWDALGKAAGFIRNHDIIRGADHALIFWDGNSKGTAHDISLCHKYRVPYTLYWPEV